MSYKLVLYGAFGPYYYCEDSKYGENHKVFESIEEAERAGIKTKLVYEAVKVYDENN